MNYIHDLNTDINTRDQLIFGEDYDKSKYYGGIRLFENMTSDTMQKLLDQKFAQEDDAQNDMPCIKELMEYASNHKNVTFNGYAVTADRNDYRISVDVIRQDFENPKTEILDFTEHFRHADEFQINAESGYAWYD